MNMQKLNFERMLAIRAGLVLAALCLLSARPAMANLVTLENTNSRADFYTDDTDPGVKGLFNWSVDGVNHIAQQWFWYRIGAVGGESSIDTLNLTTQSTSNIDGVAGDDFLLALYADPNQRFEIQVRYMLTGGEDSAGHSGLSEIIRIKNLSTTTPLDFHFFQYVDFNLNGVAGDDTLSITGTPPNTAYQFDPFAQIAETVVTPPPTHFQVSGAALSLLGSMTDAASSTLSDAAGPVSGDVAWAFQWDFTLAPGGTFIIGKDKSLRAVPIPEPSGLALMLAGAAFGLVRVTRRRASRRNTRLPVGPQAT